LQAWECLLPRSHPKRQYILDGIQNGFRFFCDKNTVLSTITSSPGEVVKNYNIPDSAWLNAFFDAEVASGRILELNSPQGVLFHPLGMRPKAVGYRLIMDISLNHLNDCMSPPSFELRLLQKVFKVLRYLGSHWWISKVDASVSPIGNSS
jgi:hypothetical protein